MYFIIPKEGASCQDKCRGLGQPQHPPMESVGMLRIVEIGFVTSYPTLVFKTGHIIRVRQINLRVAYDVQHLRPHRTYSVFSGIGAEACNAQFHKNLVE